MAGKIKVVFASLLKPVDEPRMYEKLGRSLAQTYKYDVNIIGFKSKNLPEDPLLTFWPIFNFRRISPGRLLAPIRFFKKLLQVKPKLIIASGTDLLLVSGLYKILFGCLIINDLQENYYRNIIWSHHQPSLLRKLRAAYVRWQELLIDRIIIQYTLAERTYLIECSFITKPTLVLENKACRPQEGRLAKKEKGDSLQLVYTGTIAASYGIFDALLLADTIQKLIPATTLTLCGHCPSDSVHKKLLHKARTRPWLILQISSTPLPHTSILRALQQADFSLVAYQLNPANENCMPTRIWEALAWQTPMILRSEHPWISLVEQYQAGFAIDYLNPDPEVLLKKLLHTNYYTQPLPAEIYWESIEKEWITLVDSLPFS